MIVKDIMTKEPFFISPDDSVNQAAQKMAGIECGILLVGDDKEHCTGVITDRDIVIRVLAKGENPEKTKVKDAMTKEVYYIYEEDKLDKAAQTMRDHEINRLLVKDKKENITGIITFGAMLWKTESAAEFGHILDNTDPRKALAS
ncbi:MAG: hypothetical protein COV35_05920 [Alphaproteobacteria bacterium CG11_big_fil_rev_8_21_14_0_20_39_49]|nr:MAG: hypothetical protein COV35_05920 [Alphaproteobacteria bacterium CG11_big_fil_rev_8_21_14_0_20_39_49]